MRFHIGFSKRISKKTIIFLLGLISMALAMFFGNTDIVFADTTINAQPGYYAYYRDNSSSAIIPSVTCNSNHCYYDVNNFNGFNGYDFTYSYDHGSISCQSRRADITYQVWLRTSGGASNISDNLNLSNTGNNGTALVLSMSPGTIQFKLRNVNLDNNVTFKVNASGGSSTSVGQAWILNRVTYDCITDSSSQIIDNATQNTQDIIDNANSNTQSIIDNQNQNNQAIINNNNQNTQDIINSNKSCKFIDKSFIYQTGKYLNSTGIIGPADVWGITDYISILNSDISLVFNNNFTSATHFCFYDIDKQLLSCVANTGLSTSSVITIPNNAFYVRFTINSSTNKPSFKICTNGSQAISDSLTDDNISTANSTGTSFFNNFHINDTRGLTSIITAPIRLLQGIVNSNDTCSDYTFNIQILGTSSTSVTLPSGCILWNNVPQAVVVSYWIIVWAIVGYRCLVDMIHFASSLRDPDKKNDYTLDL